MNLALDLFRNSDAFALFEADSDPEHRSRFEFPESFVPSLEHDREVIAGWTVDRQSGARYTFAFRDAASGEALGGGELRQLSKGVANLSYWTRPSWRRRGVATRGVALLLSHAFHALGFSRVEAAIDTDNEASLRVVKAAGFREAGLRGSRWLFVAEAGVAGRMPE